MAEVTRHEILAWLQEGQSILKRLPPKYAEQLPVRRIERFLRRWLRRASDLR